ncbi:MAG: MarR family transcriptional regulator [Gemmobacter sp.]|nr:MarR family transcriptional regulator [Gemmobacter sp.]
MTNFDLSTFLPYQLAVASARTSRDFADRYRTEFGLSIAEWRVLAHLSQSGSVSVREIHAKVDMDKSQVSRAAARLESAGLVAKRSHPTDGRLVDLTLTDAGHVLFSRLVPVALEYQAELVSRLGSEADLFRAALTRMTEDSR